jgi:CBS domain containing-hemolysin-like protein/mannitol/fructose-specific phosphotransferase system IIA component (Ntr-type)
MAAVNLLYLSIGLALLVALNAFFVLAEFAIVKVRSSRVAQLVAAGDPRAAVLVAVQAHLDEYLSVCQVGITLASVALGMVGEAMASALLGGRGAGTLRYLVAIGVSYLLVSGSHILLGELVPKSIAIRVADRAALWCAAPLRLFHRLFFPALWVLTRLSNAILRLFGMGTATNEAPPSEDELRIILDQSQARGVMSFRRLLFMENVFDLGELTVRDAMRPRVRVRTLEAHLPWEENLKVIRGSRYSRYPLIVDDDRRPTGFVHLKDLVIHGGVGDPDLVALARPLLTIPETTPLEALLAMMQRRRIHAALVTDEGDRWTGFVTLEDVIEELVGTIRDEFQGEPTARLADALSPDRVCFGLDSVLPLAAVREALARTASGASRLPVGSILRALESRERPVGTYLGDGIALRFARVAGLDRPVLLCLYAASAFRIEGTLERARLMFVLCTPYGQPRVHQRLQFTLTTLLNESDFVRERLLTATTAEEVVEVIRTGEQAALD